MNIQEYTNMDTLIRQYEKASEKLITKLDDTTCSLNAKKYDEQTGEPFWHNLGNISTTGITEIVKAKQDEIDKFNLIKAEIELTCVK